VIAFAGDALICVFTDISIYSKDMQDKHTYMELCCISALNCGLKSHTSQHSISVFIGGSNSEYPLFSRALRMASNQHDPLL
jgi:hypothetical protein